jgi:hypothetical protein
MADEYSLNWSAADTATSYTLQEADSNGFTNPRTRYVGEGLDYRVTGQAGGTWYYRVRASNDGGNSLWSNLSLTTVSTPALDPPSLLAIDNGDGDGDYLVDWSEISGTIGYTLEESIDPYFVSSTVAYAGAASKFSVTGQSSGHWYYRVRGFGLTGNSPWSNEEFATVLTYVYMPITVRGHQMGGAGNFGLPITEGFEGGVVPPSGWLRVRTNPRQTWKIMQVGTPYAGSFAADCQFDAQTAPQNEVLLSPEFQADQAELKFRSFGSLFWCREDSDNCDLRVWLVVGAWGGGDDIFVGIADDDWTGTWVWSPSTMDLTPHLPYGTPVRVGFQYLGQDGAQIALDAISITQ